MAQVQAQRVADGCDNLAQRYGKQLLPEPSAGDAVSQIDQAVNDENPHSEEMPLQAVLRPSADHQEIGEAQPAEQNIVVVDPPAAPDHDENRNRVNPMHDAHAERVKTPFLTRS